MRSTLFDKIWDLHTVATLPSGQTQLFIGLHLIHEVTSPQAFAMLKERGLKVLRPDRTFATVDHIIPTDSQIRPFADGLAEAMLQELRESGLGGWLRIYRTTVSGESVVPHPNAALQRSNAWWWRGMSAPPS